MPSTTCQRRHCHGTYLSHTEEPFKQLFYKNGKEIMLTTPKPLKKLSPREE
jgi:hypothetical protein